MKSKFVQVGNVKTHYIEAGSGEPLILLHGAEYGGSAMNSWEYNIPELSKHFHVFAVDIVGFGHTSKIFNFDDAAAFRLQHIKEFLKVMCIDEAYFIGNSLGGGMTLFAAAQDVPLWPIKKIITISGGGPNRKEAHDVLNHYDCTFEYMKKIHDYLFYNDKWKTDEYVRKRYETSLIPGAWEAASAARFKSPLAKEKELVIPDYSKVKVPVLICAGDHDRLKRDDYAESLKAKIPHAQVKIFKDCGHCAQIEYADEFNRLAIEFLKS
jgi:pimeloyl-ACP methyl ester carboxylesterase